MSRPLRILKAFLEEIETYNPYNLIIKGGIALSLYYLNQHRESEDLDFDTEIKNKENIKEIETYLINILSKLKKGDVIQDYEIGKTGFALTNRYHMKLKFITYKDIDSKIDIDFVSREKVNKKGQLLLYPLERIFVTKCITFINRKEFKDLYDISKLITKIDVEKLKNEKINDLLDKVIIVISQEDVAMLFKQAFRNVDLRLKDVKASQLDKFTDKLIKDLRVLKNKIRKCQNLFK